MYWKKNGKYVKKDGVYCKAEECPCDPLCMTCGEEIAGVNLNVTGIANGSCVHCAAELNGDFDVTFTGGTTTYEDAGELHYTCGGFTGFIEGSCDYSFLAPPGSGLFGYTVSIDYNSTADTTEIIIELAEGIIVLRKTVAGKLNCDTLDETFTYADRDQDPIGPVCDYTGIVFHLTGNPFP